MKKSMTARECWHALRRLSNDRDERKARTSRTNEIREQLTKLVGPERARLAEGLAFNHKQRKQPMWRTCRVTGKLFPTREEKVISELGLMAMLEKAAEQLWKEKHISLPHNWFWSAGEQRRAHERNPVWYCSPAEYDEELRYIGRYAGWLRAAGELPAVTKVLQKTQSGRGINSRHTTLDLQSLINAFPSPGKLERKLWKVKARAEAILSAFEGQKPSWAAVAQGAVQSGQTGKSAIIAAAKTLSGFPQLYPSGYTKARGWLIDYHLCKVADELESITVLREAKPRLEELGMEVFRIAVPITNRRGRQVGVQLDWLIRTADGRTYGSRSNGDDPREALLITLGDLQSQAPAATA